MKRLLLLLTSAILMVGCVESARFETEAEARLAKDTYTTVNIEGCEYIIIASAAGHKGFMAHKGNCKNHR